MDPVLAISRDSLIFLAVVLIFVFAVAVSVFHRRHTGISRRASDPASGAADAGADARSRDEPDDEGYSG